MYGKINRKKACKKEQRQENLKVCEVRGGNVCDCEITVKTLMHIIRYRATVVQCHAYTTDTKCMMTIKLASTANSAVCECTTT